MNVMQVLILIILKIIVYNVDHLKNNQIFFFLMIKCCTFNELLYQAQARDMKYLQLLNCKKQKYNYLWVLLRTSY